MMAFARSLSPIFSMASGVGPMNTRPAASTSRAKDAFSERNPYPGWIASAPQAFATSMILSPRRYDSAGGGAPMRYASSACSTCNACASIDEWTATVRMESRRQVRITRQAISPRLAMRTFENMARFYRCYHGRMFYGVTDIATYVLGTIFIILLPGPNSMYVMTIAARQGIAPAYRAACGVFLGDAVLMALAAAG